jgi:hypothetical protein
LSLVERHPGEARYVLDYCYFLWNHGRPIPEELAAPLAPRDRERVLELIENYRLIGGPHD